MVKDSTRSVIVNELAFTLFDMTECKRCLDCVVETIDKWTRDHFTYVADEIRSMLLFGNPDVETVNTPAEDIRQILDNGTFEGDCDDVSVFVAAMFKSLGLTTRFVAIRTDPLPAPYTHVFVEVLTGDRWKTVDITVPSDTVHNEFGRMEIYV